MENFVYQLTDTRSNLKKALPYWLVGGLLLLAGFSLSGLAAWFSLAGGLLAGAIGVANFLSRNEQSVLLATDRLIVRTKAGDKTLMLAELTKAELSYTAPDGSMKKTGVFNAESLAADAKSILSLTDASNKRLEVAATDYALPDFQAFLEVFRVNANSGRLIDEQKFDELIRQNSEYIRQDKQLKANLQQTLLEGYKAVYVQRGDLYLRQHPQAQVLYKHQPNPNDGAVYFLENDFIEGLDANALQAGQTLLAQAAQNMATVEARMACYQKIADKLQGMKEAQQARARLGKAAGRLDTLQKQNELANERQGELLLQTDTLEQLKLLSQDLRNMDDFGTANILKQVDEILK